MGFRTPIKTGLPAGNSGQDKDAVARIVPLGRLLELVPEGQS